MGPSAESLVVAVTRWGSPPADEAGPLAELLGLVAYELRLRLVGPLPVVLLRTDDAEQARALRAVLHERGHGAVGCREAAIVHAGDMLTGKHFELGPEALRLDDGHGDHPVDVPYADLLVLVHASHSTVEEVETRERRKQLSVGRALLTGGLSVRKTVTHESRARTEERRPVLYLFRRSGAGTVILREDALRYDGLGEELDRSSHTNFVALVRHLRERAPGALYDDRLLTGRRPSTQLDLSGTTARSVVAASNADATDLAAHLIALAHVQGQL